MILKEIKKFRKMFIVADLVSLNDDKRQINNKILMDLPFCLHKKTDLGQKMKCFDRP